MNGAAPFAPPRGSFWWPAAERYAGLAATLVAAGLHFRVWWSAGALWRDEATSAGIASLPSIGEIWRHLQCDSFPLLWPLVLRAWTSLGPVGSDAWLRSLGLLIGLGILAVLWLNARRMGYGIPTVALALLGFNAAVIRYGDSVRGYGLGTLLGLLAFGLIWSVTESPRPWRVGLALVAALAAVHSLFYDCLVVLAACAGGVAVSARHRRWRTAALVTGIGVVCALSMLPYAWTLGSSREWVMTVQYDFVDLGWVWRKFREAAATSGSTGQRLWLVTTVVCVSLAARAQSPRRAGTRQRDVALYCCVALAVGIPAYVLFLRSLRYLMQPWYFLALLALVATCLDGCLAASEGRRWLRPCRLGFLVLLVAFTLPRLAGTVSERKTNVDLVAARVESAAGEGDVIVLNPWFYGHTFRRYYHGPGRWTTLPPIEIPHLPGDYGLLKLKRQMMNREAVQPVLSAMAEALRAGHRVWWIGRLELPLPGHVVPAVEPAPNGPFGWREDQYHAHWGLQAGAFLAEQALRCETVPVNAPGPVDKYEEVSLWMFEGWKPGPLDGQPR